MRKIIHATAFRQNPKKRLRQGKDRRKLVEIFDLLAKDAELEPRFRDHALKGTWRGRRELHVESDWLVIYHIENNTVYLVGTGSHSELFDS